MIFTAYAPELLIKMRNATKNRKILRTKKKVKICVVKLPCSVVKLPNLFQRKHSAVLKTFLLKTQGSQRVGFLPTTPENLCGSNISLKKKTTSGTRGQELTSEGSAAAFRTAVRRDITEATSQSWDKAHRQPRNNKFMQWSKFTRTHTLTHVHVA